MSSSADPRWAGIVPADAAQAATAVRFDVDLRRGRRVTDGLLADERAAAHAVGYAAGWAEGQRAAHDAALAATAAATAGAREASDERAAAVRRALDAVGAAATALERRVLPSVADAEQAILGAALALAEALLGRELSLAEAPGLDAIRRALALAPSRRPVLVRLSPADHAALAGGARSEYDVDGRMVTVVADPTLQPGDAVAECDATTVDARLGAALERVREVLAP
jgi:flagellar assembly protein FliH